MVYCGIQELKLMTGVMAAPGDPNSAERGIIRTIDLLTPENMEGFRIDAENQWTPKRAQVKNGGLWVETATADGRELLAAKRGNVIETITLLLRASTMLLLNKRLAELERFSEDAKDFFETSWQIEPCYIKRWAQGSPRPVYSRVYLVNVDAQMLDYGDVNQIPLARVVLTIEREYRWLGLAPGTNPIEWTFQAQGKTRGSTTPSEGYTYTNMSLFENTDHLAYGLIDNFQELQLDYVTPITKNYLDIPASAIPGDAPALVLIDYLSNNIDNSGLNSNVTDVYIAKSTKPTTLSSHPTVKTHKTLTTLNVGDATAAAGLTKTADASRGLISNGSTTTKYYGEVTFSANPQTRSISWGNSSTLIQTLDANTLRGTYAVFLRHKQNAGALGDITLQLEVRIGPGVANTTTLYQSQVFEAVNAVVLNAGLSAKTYGVAYLGMVKIPFVDDAVSAVKGWGLDVVQNGQLSLEMRVNVRRTTGVATMYIADLVMLPMDECLTEVHTPTDDVGRPSPSNGDYWHMFYDNTGYLSHGKSGARGYAFFEQSGTPKGVSVNMELRGGELNLTPGVNNRLFFIYKRFEANTNAILSPVNFPQQTVRINIIPCWLGDADI